MQRVKVKIPAEENRRRFGVIVHRAKTVKINLQQIRRAQFRNGPDIFLRRIDTVAVIQYDNASRRQFSNCRSGAVGPTFAVNRNHVINLILLKNRIKINYKAANF